jgi:hypothetical protein
MPPATALDRFFDHYYRRRPVSATLTGVHDYDALLPDWSPRGLQAMDAEMAGLAADFAASQRSAALEPGAGAARPLDAVALDTELARDFLAIQRAENAGTHGVRRNPSLWVGEAVFSVIALMIRDFAPRIDRMASATSRLSIVPDFLSDAQRTLDAGAMPRAWIDKAVHECQGARILVTRGVEAWIGAGNEPSESARALRAAAAGAESAIGEFTDWLECKSASSNDGLACGSAFYDLLLSRGHRSERSAEALLEAATRRLGDEETKLQELAAAVAGSWPAALKRIAEYDTEPANYLPAFGGVWDAARQCALIHDVVTWPDWPIRYVTYPEWTREAAPYLYYLHYRSPAPFDRYTIHDYIVPALPAGAEEQHLRTWNNSVIKLNHVVHHGGIGHHVQNWFASHRAASRIGQVAAVDCANRIGMFCGGTMAEGWATYVTGLMDELGFLTPLEQVSDQHTRVRFLGRAIVDIELHRGAMSLDDAIAFYMTRIGMGADAARGEAVKNSMFPGTAIMYWLGTQGILDLRATLAKRRGSAFSLRTFHDELLAHGSIPVPLIARLLT